MQIKWYEYNSIPSVDRTSFHLWVYPSMVLHILPTGIWLVCGSQKQCSLKKVSVAISLQAQHHCPWGWILLSGRDVLESFHQCYKTPLCSDSWIKSSLLSRGLLCHATVDLDSSYVKIVHQTSRSVVDMATCRSLMLRYMSCVRYVK